MNEHKPLTQNLGDKLVEAQVASPAPPKRRVRGGDPSIDIILPAQAQKPAKSGDKNSEAEGTAAKNINNQNNHVEKNMNENNGTVAVESSVSQGPVAKGDFDSRALSSAERVAASLEKISEKGVVLNFEKREEENRVAGAMLIGGGVGLVIGATGGGIGMAYLGQSPTNEDVTNATLAGGTLGFLGGMCVGAAIGGRKKSEKKDEKK